MTRLRWPDGITCSRCRCKAVSFIKTRRLWICKDCKKNFTVKVGTIMEDSPVGLDKWLIAMWMIANAKDGVSSLKAHRVLGVTQKSAWFMLHRIKLATQDKRFENRPGPIVRDDTLTGSKAHNTGKSKRKKIQYQRFEDLARQLLAVSKKELNKRRAEYERKRKKKKARKK